MFGLHCWWCACIGFWLGWLGISFGVWLAWQHNSNLGVQARPHNKPTHVMNQASPSNDPIQATQCQYKATPTQLIPIFQHVAQDPLDPVWPGGGVGALCGILVQAFHTCLHKCLLLLYHSYQGSQTLQRICHCLLHLSVQLLP